MTHTSGVGHITFLRETTGIWNAINQHMPGWFWLLLIGVGFLPWFIQIAQRSDQIDKLLKRVNVLESEKDKGKSSGEKER